MKTALITSPFNPFSANLIKNLVELKTPIDALILDTFVFGQKTHDIWEERTNGKMPFQPIHEIVASHIPVYYVAHHNKEDCVNLVKEQGFDLLVNGGTPRIVGPELLNATKYGVLNVHAGLLPEYRGCTCVEWAIYNDDPVGLTAHLMTERIDEGPIVSKETIKFSKNDTYADVRMSVYHHIFEMIDRTIRQMGQGDFDISALSFTTEGGQYYKPIPDDKHQEMVEKLEAGKYRFQL